MLRFRSTWSADPSGHRSTWCSWEDRELIPLDESSRSFLRAAGTSGRPERKTYADVTAVHATPQSGREESEGDESDESSSGSSRSAGYSQAQVDTLIEDNSKRLELAHAAERNSRATAYEEKVDMLQNDMKVMCSRMAKQEEFFVYSKSMFGQFQQHMNYTAQLVPMMQSLWSNHTDSMRMATQL